MAIPDEAEFTGASYEIPLDDPKPADKEVVVPETKANGAVVTPEQNLDAVQAELEETRRQRDVATRTAQEAEQRAQTIAGRAAELEAQGQDSNLAMLNATLETMKAARQQLTQRKVHMKRTGDAAAEAEVDVQLMELAQDQREVERGRRRVEQQVEDRGQYQPPQQKTPDQAWNEYAAQFTTQPTRQWIEAHRDELQGPEGRRFEADMLAAHNLAVSRRGLTVDTPEYFQFVDEQLGVQTVTTDHSRPAQAAPARQAAAPSPQPRSAPVAAPVKGTSSARGGSTVTVKLSPEQQKMARDIGVPEEEYARQHARLIREGHAKYQKGI